MTTSDLRRLADRLLRHTRRDSLGLCFDIEAQLDVVDAVAARFFRSPSDASFREWQSLVAALPEPVDDPLSCARVTAHRVLSAMLARDRRPPSGSAVSS